MTLETGRGFCGENARVSVLLLLMGGVAAHRIYLFGPSWGHVAVAFRWGTEWCLFDAHADPLTLHPEERIGQVRADDLASFSNGYPQNPWLAVSWSKPLGRFPALSRLHPPGFVCVLYESPDLVKSLLGATVAAAGLAFLVLG